MTAADPVPRPTRVAGVDVARGAALLGMMAMHTLDAFDDEGAPRTASIVAAGRSTATFVLLAGVSLAFMSGGRRVVQGRDRLAVAGGLVVRALLIDAWRFRPPPWALRFLCGDKQEPESTAIETPSRDALSN